MLAPRVRGALGPIIIGVVIAIAACTNGTEPTAKCDTATPLSLTPGEVQTGLPGACVFVSGDGEFALVPFNTSTNDSNTATLKFSGTGISSVSTPLTSLVSAASPMSATAPSLTSIVASTPLLPSFELQLRETERRVLTPLMPAARSWYRNRSTGGAGGLRPSFSLSSASWAIGDTVVLNTDVGATLAATCTTKVMRGGEVEAISNHAIVVADTGNPAGGYTPTDYQNIAIQFDSVYAMDTTAFGGPTDIDSNGHVVLFFTRAVNALTPPHSSSVVGGFFYSRDLFPRSDTPDIEGCPSSNVAEMFYLLVPDPNGVVNSNVFTKSQVSLLTVSTTAHEFQHLINASRRLYINNAPAFEETWLNEGLSHIAEELLFYQQSGLSPLMNIDSAKLFGSQKVVDAFRNDQTQNVSRFAQYLARPTSTSPYAHDDSLWTRGATWSFLRYAADHRNAPENDTWFRLVNTTSTGIQNLMNVFGSGVSSMFRDWAIATFADDVPGVGTEWQQPSWNFRNLFDCCSTSGQHLYPLGYTTVGSGSSPSVLLHGGSAAYVRFVVAAGQVGNVTWGRLPSNVTMSIVRLR